MDTRLHLSTVILLAAGLVHLQAAEIAVRPGDTLSNLAKTHLGDAARWPEICEANRSALRGGCHVLPIGAVLSLPEAEAQQSARPSQPTSETDSLVRSAEGPSQSGDDLASPPWTPVRGLAVAPHADGTFELVSDGAEDPGLGLTIAVDPAGKSFRLTGEAKAGDLFGAVPILRVFGYAVAEDGTPDSLTIALKDQILGEGFEPFSIELAIPEDFHGSGVIAFRLDPGDGVPGGTNAPPAGYSICVRNVSVVQLD